MTATEAERRRAAGEEPFCNCTECVTMAQWLLLDAAHGDRVTLGQGQRVATLFRALVLQELLKTFSPPWEVST